MNTWKHCRHFDIKNTMRLRITFSKSGALRYTGHLDLQTTWERTIRRARLPLAYTQGFHPGPRIQIASALPLGFIGRAEIVDIWLEGPASPVGTGFVPVQGDHYAHILQPAAPPGLTLLSVEQVGEADPALQTQVESAEYEVTLLEPLDEMELAKRLAALLNAQNLPRERRGKAYNLRPLIEALSSMPAPLQDRVFMRLAARPGATARPEEVLDVLGIPFETTRIERTRLILKSELR
jgi:radical SAM-linked protein